MEYELKAKGMCIFLLFMETFYALEDIRGALFLLNVWYPEEAPAIEFLSFFSPLMISGFRIIMLSLILIYIKPSTDPLDFISQLDCLQIVSINQCLTPKLQNLYHSTKWKELDNNSKQTLNDLVGVQVKRSSSLYIRQASLESSDFKDVLKDEDDDQREDGSFEYEQVIN